MKKIKQKMFQAKYKGKDILVISDTHGKHRDLIIPPADIIIHCGDVCQDGDEEQLFDFFRWYSALTIKNKIFVSGNHDYLFEFEPEKALELIPNNVYFLKNSKINLDGITYGSLSPNFYFEETYLIQANVVDILITHNPPFGLLDNGSGCKELLSAVNIINPYYHFFGHIHECSGSITKNGTVFVNASL